MTAAPFKEIIRLIAGDCVRAGAANRIFNQRSGVSVMQQRIKDIAARIFAAAKIGALRAPAEIQRAVCAASRLIFSRVL